MPYIIRKRNGKHCVYKEGADKEPEGESLGCHDSDTQAQEQQRALYASESAKALYESLKVGMRNNATDQAGLNAMHAMSKQLHDMTVKNGAECDCEGMTHEAEPGDVADDAAEDMGDGMMMNKSLSDALVAFGGEIKALGGGKVGGYLVRHTTQNDPDLTTDFFAKDTDLGNTSNLPVMYQHGLDMKLGRRRIGQITESRRDDVGLWVESQLEMRDEYERAIYEMAQAGKLGWSSGAAAHTVEREQVGKSFKIKQWYIAEASLTPTPAEPRNQAIPLKSLSVGNLPPGWETLVNAPDGARADTKSTPPTQSHLGANMATEFESQVLTALAGINTKFDTQAKEIDALKSQVNQPQLPPAQPVTIPEGAIKTGKITDVRNNASENPYKSFGEFMVDVGACAGGRPPARLQNFDDAIKSEIKAAAGLNMTVGPEGGWTVPPAYIPQIMSRTYGIETSPFVSRANRLPSDAAMGTIPMLKETSRADGFRDGGVLAYWLAEAGTKSATFPKFNAEQWLLKELAVLVPATNQLLSNAPMLTALISDLSSKAINFKINQALFNANGQGKPHGIMNSPALVTAALESGQTSATPITVGNLSQMYMQFYGNNAPGTKAAWFINKELRPYLDRLTLPVGTGGSTDVRFVRYNEKGTLTIHGLPVIDTEFNSAVNTTGDIALWDMDAYWYIDRPTEFASSIHVYFDTNQTAFRFSVMCEGLSSWANSVVLANGSVATSPFVVLATRS